LASLSASVLAQRPEMCLSAMFTRLALAYLHQYTHYESSDIAGPCPESRSSYIIRKVEFLAEHVVLASPIHRSSLFYYFHLFAMTNSLSNEKISYFRTCPPSEIACLVSNEIPQDWLPVQYLQGLSEGDQTVCF